MTYDPKQYPRQQDEEELHWLTREITARNATSFLEIGSRFGQTLWAIGRSLPTGSLIVSVDKPADQQGREAMELCADSLRKMGQKVHVIEADSRDSNAVGAVRALLASHERDAFDAIFIDADHKIESVVLDWINYGKIGKLIAFHDVGFRYNRDDLNYKPHKTPEQKRIDVPDLWRVLKDRYPHHTSECVVRPGKWGIGVLAW